MPVYSVKLEIDTYVYADNETEAETEAIYTAAREETPAVTSIVAVEALSTVSKDWLDSIPWGSEGDKTIRELVEEETGTKETGTEEQRP